MDPLLSSFSIDPPNPIPPPPIIPIIAPAVPNPPPATAAVSLPPPSFNHPPYADMICEAIGALKEKNGSSKRAISKYIESAFKTLPPTHPALLTHHLKRLKNNGLLVMVKKSYKLASTARSEASVPESSPPNPPDASPSGPKRGRGRPPKPKPTVPSADPNPNPNTQLQSVTVPVPVSAPVPAADGTKKSPGRPRKNGPVPVGQIGARKGRGRPPKSGPKKSPGRPRKPKTVRSVVGVKRGRGRPPKNTNQLAPQGVMPILGQPMAVPYADAAAATTTVAVPSLPRPRGRPKGTGGGPAAGVVVSGKRRGRPPKIAGVAAKPIAPKKTTGKPVGRPKKITNGADSKELREAYEDATGLLEFYQSKVKQIVGVLKPHFTPESNINAISAIHDLEGLAVMDISTPFKRNDQPGALLPPPPTQPAVPQIDGYVH
ncbi:hypothetical protein PTKIN_Ptkin02bG0023200 [Pterospermum kingtungense]